MDIEKFFDTIDHRWMMECLKQRVEDRSLLRLIARFLKGGVLEEGKYLETFDFLGFTHYCDRTRRGFFKLGRKTSSKKFRQKAKELNLWLKKVRSAAPLKEWRPILKTKLTGHYRYHGVSGNHPALRRYSTLASKLAYKWINRRSQKKSYTFAKYLRFLAFDPLPKPRIYYSLFTLSSLRGCVTEEPYAGNPHVRFCEGH
jgi:hypothetical protein